MKFFGIGSRSRVPAEVGNAAVGHENEVDPSGEKNVGNERADLDSDADGGSLERLPSPDVQGGVKKAEAVTLTWSRNELILAYACVFLVFFVVSMEEQIQNNLGIYVTSSFALLPLTGTASIMSGIVGGVLKLPTAKFVDIIGRAEGFMVMTGLATLGLIMMAATKNVETYAAGQVFYWSGFDGMAYVLDVFMADTSSLKNRALVFAFTTTPYIVTTFIGPRAASSFQKTSGWRWAFGSFSIITPVIAAPIVAVLYANQRKAYKSGLLKREKSGRTLLQSVNYYFWEFDVIGLLLIIAGFTLFLLPFSLASYARGTWHSASIIAMLVVGILCLIAFGLYERFFAKVSFVPFFLLKDGSVIGACLLAAFLFISFYLWDSYFYNYLQAVHGLDIINAGYVSNIYSIGSCFWAVILALMIRVVGRFKYIAMAHLCLQILGVGLMIHFRQSTQGIGYVVMCQIFIAFGGGALVICEQMAVMAAAPHQNVAVMLALIGLFSSVGGAIGQAVSGAIYTNRFPAALDRALPGNTTLNAELYGSITNQISYPFGTPERNAVLYAYDDAMWYLTIASTVFLVPCFVFIAIWKDFKVKELRKVKGRAV